LRWDLAPSWDLLLLSPREAREGTDHVGQQRRPLGNPSRLEMLKRLCGDVVVDAAGGQLDDRRPVAYAQLVSRDRGADSDW
jgi:hypothetical protein